LKNKLLILTLLLTIWTFGQKVYTDVEQISEFESYHSNLMVNRDSTVVFTQYYADYHTYEEYVGSIHKVKKHEYQLDLKLAKSLTVRKRPAANQLFISVEKDSAMLKDYELKIWDFTEETIYFEMELSKAITKLDTVVPVTPNNPALVYTPFWNPTNKDEIVQRINWNATPVWRIYSTPQGKYNASVYVDQDYFEITKAPKLD